MHTDLDLEAPAQGTFLGAWRKGLARLQGADGRDAQRTYLPPDIVERAQLWALALDLQRATPHEQAVFRAAVGVVLTFCFFARGGTGSALRAKHVRRAANGLTITLEHEKGRATAARA